MSKESFLYNAVYQVIHLWRVREDSEHSWPSSNDKYLKSILGSVSCCSLLYINK